MNGLDVFVARFNLSVSPGLIDDAVAYSFLQIGCQPKHDQKKAIVEFSGRDVLVCLPTGKENLYVLLYYQQFLTT
jgi:hypothetical protein